MQYTYGYKSPMYDQIASAKYFGEPCVNPAIRVFLIFGQSERKVCETWNHYDVGDNAGEGGGCIGTKRAGISSYTDTSQIDVRLPPAHWGKPSPTRI